MSPRRLRISWPSALGVSVLSCLFGYVAGAEAWSLWVLPPICLAIGVFWPFPLFVADEERP